MLKFLLVIFAICILLYGVVSWVVFIRDMIVKLKTKKTKNTNTDNLEE